MGTPEFAVASLDALLQSGHELIAVVTAPDKPAGRGQAVQESAVKKFAKEKGLKILQPNKLKDESFLAELRSYYHDLQVVVAFRMLPEVVWSMPKLGTINLHASLLPQYRGAAPINWAIMNGERQTGITTFLLSNAIDTGDIFLSEEVHIDENESAGELHDRLMVRGAQLLVKTVNMMEKGEVKAIKQSLPSNDLKIAPKIFREDCRINWNDKARAIHNKIRGLSPYPAAWTTLHIPGAKSQLMKIYQSSLTNDVKTSVPGTVQCDNENVLSISTGDGSLQILELQLEGKKRMNVKDFLLGTKLNQETLVR